MIWRGRAGGKPETGDVALMVLCSLLSLLHKILKKWCVTPHKTY